jgi:hypothetical protein
VVFNPDVYPMSWAWITGDLTEHEMKLEHGQELERIHAAEKGRLQEFSKAAAVGGGRIYPVHQESEVEVRSPSPRRGLYGTIQNLNEKIKNWRGV